VFIFYRPAEAEAKTKLCPFNAFIYMVLFCEEWVVAVYNF